MVAVSESVPGASHDKKLSDGVQTVERWSEGCEAEADKGCQGLEGGARLVRGVDRETGQEQALPRVTGHTPFKKPPGGELTEGQTAFHRWLNGIRGRVKHCIGWAKHGAIWATRFRCDHTIDTPIMQTVGGSVNAHTQRWQDRKGASYGTGFYVPHTDTETAVYQLITESALMPDEELRDVCRLMNEMKRQEWDAQAAQVGGAARRLKEVESEIRNLMDAIRKGISPELVAEESHRLQAERERLRKQAETEKVKPFKPVTVADLRRWNTLLERALIRCSVTKMEVDPAPKAIDVMVRRRRDVERRDSRDGRL